MLAGFPVPKQQEEGFGRVSRQSNMLECALTQGGVRIAGCALAKGRGNPFQRSAVLTSMGGCVCAGLFRSRFSTRILASVRSVAPPGRAAPRRWDRGAKWRWQPGRGQAGTAGAEKGGTAEVRGWASKLCADVCELWDHFLDHLDHFRHIWQSSAFSDVLGHLESGPELREMAQTAEKLD